MIEYNKYKKTLQHLIVQFENYRTLDKHQPKLIQEAVAESVIQRFETCYDCMWEILKRYLSEELGIPEVPHSPKPIFRLAFENDLFISSIEAWLKYADARIGTSPDYNGKKAKVALKVINNFTKDAIALYETMSGKAWK